MMEPPKLNGSHPNYKRETDAINTPDKQIDEIVEPIFEPGAIPDYHRAAYIREYAPQILAALIVRRASSDPEHLVEVAIRNAGRLYDILQHHAADP